MNMMKDMFKQRARASRVAKFIICIILLGWSCLFAQNATIEERMTTFRTYPFGDPSPVPRMNKIYPYFRFDGYSHEGIDKDWKVVCMENPHVKVFVTPEIGGKIWGGIEKSTENAFIYFNKVVKFRNIAMRGPWTSGGIEFNFGAIGHTPTTATPVDYLFRENADGSVSCYVGAMDLPSRTEWRVEIHLPRDKAYVETRAFWFNPTELNTSLYHWMNGSADAGEDLHYCFPGNHYIGHGGQVHSWPVHESGRDISIYGNNDFGGAKSYHVIGGHTDFFGGIWKKEGFGFGHWSPYGEKPGKKIWIWGLSRQGMIWEDLLTDTDLGNIQYTEIQTGLLFNQAGGNSGLTPFKHRFFIPNGVQRFTEAWFPVKDMDGMVEANRYGALNVIRDQDLIKLEFCPLQKIDGRLIVTVDGKRIHEKELHLDPLIVFRDTVPVDDHEEFEVVIGDHLLSFYSGDGEARILDRPLTIDSAFDWESIFGLYTDGNERARQRDYRGALNKYLACLEKDPLYSPALVGAAEIYYRRMEYDRALAYVKKALANDAYDPDANFIYGIIHRKLGNLYNARDGFGIASGTMKTRSAASVQLAEMAFMKGDMTSARMFALRALDYNRYNMNALKVLALCHRKQNQTKAAEEILERMLEIDPLNHWVRFEKFLLNSSPENLKTFQTMIRNELPHETYLELAMGYVKLDLWEEAVHILEKAPDHTVVHYWQAYLLTQMGEKGQAHLEKALQSSPFLVYPFRQETVPVLRWALEQKDHWKTKYYLGLIYWSKDRIETAKRYFQECGDSPDYAPFFLTRGDLFRSEASESVLKDYQSAVSLDPNAWRGYLTLSQYFSDLNQYDMALKSIRKGTKKFSKNYILQSEYARQLLFNNHYEDCLKVLEDIDILPNEGARFGRDIYRQACVLFALDRIKKKKYDGAIDLVRKARLWPEHLGVGMPYDVDNRLENFIEAFCHEKLDRADNARALHEKILVYTRDHPELYNSNRYLCAMVMRVSGMEQEAKQLLESWTSQYPKNIAAGWSLARFQGDTNTAESFLKGLEKVQQGTPWNPVARDPHFKLVLEVAGVLY